MHIKNQNSQCDQRQLRAYLEQELTPDAEAEVERHLDRCPDCQRRICESSAEPQWWSEVNRYLKRDELDEIAGGSNSNSATSSRPDAADTHGGVAVRQIEAWLDPTDDPKYMGRFGGYEIVGVIGCGGMGVVLKGFEPSLNRYVAIKLLAPVLASTGASRKRFAREAQATAAVRHENVIAVHRVDESRDLPYLVMPYISGVSLQKRIDDEGPLSVAAVLRIGRQIAAGLAAAHAQGLVHRDIKPANILLERSIERVTITDFGLARAVDDGNLTKSGAIAGTPQYMSPEQVRGDALDARSDLFSLGSVLYAMCTGHPPFRAETGYSILRRITDSQPRSIREINPDIPEWCEAIVERLHAKSPGGRFQTAEEVAELLEQCLAHLQLPTKVQLPKSLALQRDGSGPRSCFQSPGRHPLLWAVSIGTLCVLLLAFVLTSGHRLFQKGVESGRQRPAASSSDHDMPSPGAADGSDPALTMRAGGADGLAPTSQSPTPPTTAAWEDGTERLLEELEREATRLERRAASPWDTDNQFPISTEEDSPRAKEVRP